MQVHVWRLIIHAPVQDAVARLLVLLSIKVGDAYLSRKVRSTAC